MLKNYIIIALRLLVKNKAFSIINIFGLAIGIACCLLIAMFVQDEFNYERSFSDRGRIFRINTTWVKDGSEETSGRTSPPIALEAAENLPDVSLATRAMSFFNVEQHVVRYGDRTFFEKKVLLVDSTFFDIFDYHFRSGVRETALDAPSTIVISEILASKIFGGSDPMDELLIINSGNSSDTFRVTGVIKKPMFPSHLDADIYMTMNSNGLGRWASTQTTWANNNIMWGYVRLNDPSKEEEVNRKLNDLLEARAGEELRQSGRKKILSLKALTDVRLRGGSSGSGDDGLGGNIKYVYIISTIGVFILVLACINFMNLTTARAAQRAGEVGIRKSMGAYRGNLIRQFLGESMVIVFTSLVVAFFLVWIALPLFNNATQKQLVLNSANLPFIAGASLLICLITGVVAGSYPAFFLSAMKPTEVLKGKTLSGDNSQLLRKSLVVLQFVITITLISSIVLVQRQLSFMQEKELGFSADHVVMIPLRSAAASSQYETLKTAFRSFHGVNDVSAASSLPSTPLNQDWLISKKGWSNEQSLQHEIVFVDKDYFDLLNIRLAQGRDFITEQDNLQGDTINRTKVIVNEASLAALQIEHDQAVGHELFLEFGGQRREFEIIGVAENFHQFSLHREIGPMMFILPANRTWFPYMAVSINGSGVRESLNSMRTAWESQVNDVPFEIIFLNENIATMYANENRVSTLLMISTCIAVLISSLGLYGLSVYVAERKTKEIGIRRVVGASVESIVAMLSKEYLLLIGISFCISVPLGYYAMIKWLEGFAYRIDPGLTVFVVSGAVAFGVAWITVSFESFRAANRNPANTLRN